MAIVKPNVTPVKPGSSVLSGLSDLPGIGPALAKKIGALSGPRIADLLFHLPGGLIDRSLQPKVAELRPFSGKTATLSVAISSHAPPQKRGQPYKVLAHDDSGSMEIVFFHGRPEFWKKSLPQDSVRIISGKIEFFGRTPQMAHPDYIGKPEQLEFIKTIEPVYPLTESVSNKILRKALAEAFKRLPDFDEWLDSALVKSRGWDSFKTALEAAHHPQSEKDLDPSTMARQRLAYDEILANQLALHLIRMRHKKRVKNRARLPNFSLRKALLDLLPYQLTKAQLDAVSDIDQDMRSDKPMLRLLQGDVGSGKTIVAMLTMLNAIECGQQAALMAPTEILARQHLETLSPLAEKLGLNIAIMTGRDKGKGKATTQEKIAKGEADIVIGTHALLENPVQFKNLGLVVIDEQHRFGVEQRLGFMQKGAMTDTLVMSATPIPRSLFLAIFGDLDCSRLTEKPPGRKPIDTRLISLDRFDEVESALARALAAGQKIYWVCPLVEESQILDLAAAEDRFQHLKLKFKGQVGLVHGRMKAKDKDAAMQDFIAGKTKILVATTVIEVGVNVVDATIMVIDNAQRFGLAQLHQLRGRIGRGDRASTCLLLYKPDLSETAQKRLRIMRETEDGFRIAEEDLTLRGAGEVLGIRQSGLPDLKIADFWAHRDLWPIAQKDVKIILEQAPYLTGPRGKNLQKLLYLFGKDAAVNYLKSG